jgi:transcriptional regulator GlxA family with amidase domain
VRAKELLRRSGLPLPAVAEAAGFGSPAHLSHVFRTALGCTPLRYRRDARSR